MGTTMGTTDTTVGALRITQVGLGGFGMEWLDVLLGADGVALAAVVDVSAEARTAARERGGGVPAFVVIEEALAAAPSDAVLIVVPPEMHEPVALAALRAGRHVLSEKPLAGDLAAAARLVAAVERTGLTFMVSQDYRWSEPVATLRHHLRSGLIGAPGAIRYTFNKAWDFGGWRATLPNVLLEDMTIHHVDLLRYLIGLECEELYARSYRPAWSWFAGNSAAEVLLRFADGVHATYSGSWVGAGPQTSWTGTIEVEGARGLVRLHDDALMFYPRGEPNGLGAPGQPLPLVELPRSRQDEALARFVAAVRSGATPETDIRDNIKSFAIVCAALASARANRPVRPADLIAAAMRAAGASA